MAGVGHRVILSETERYDRIGETQRLRRVTCGGRDTGSTGAAVAVADCDCTRVYGPMVVCALYLPGNATLQRTAGLCGLLPRRAALTAARKHQRSQNPWCLSSCAESA